jgi:hypothetical protein
MDISLLSSFIQIIQQVVIKHLKNGIYFPVLFYFIYYITNNLLLSIIIIMKLYPTNYFYWFGNKYNYLNIPKKYNFIKQFVRLTDTGHFVSFLYIINPEYLPLAHNIHFLITFGFWTGRYLGMRDTDYFTKDPDIIEWYTTKWSYISHGLPYLMFLRQMILIEKCYEFGYETIWYSYLWVYTWFVCIYTPWRMYTGDVIYTILSDDIPMKRRLGFIGIIHFILLMANFTGYMVNRIKNE